MALARGCVTEGRSEDLLPLAAPVSCGKLMDHLVQSGHLQFRVGVRYATCPVQLHGYSALYLQLVALDMAG